MRDEGIRELERRALSGDREALGRLKTEWLRVHDAQPALDALINKAPVSNPKGGVMFAELRAVYFIEDVESAIPKWEPIKSTVTFATQPYPQFRPVDHPWLDPIDEPRTEACSCGRTYPLETLPERCECGLFRFGNWARANARIADAVPKARSEGDAP